MAASPCCELLHGCMQQSAVACTELVKMSGSRVVWPAF